MKQGKQLQAALYSWLGSTSVEAISLRTGVSKRRLKKYLTKYYALVALARETGARRPRLIAAPPTFSVPYGK